MKTIVKQHLQVRSRPKPKYRQRNGKAQTDENIKIRAEVISRGSQKVELVRTNWCIFTFGFWDHFHTFVCINYYINDEIL